MHPAIQTTVVGSYPVPDWLRAYPTAQGLRDATLVVIRTQELAGLDVVSDGELSRFDINHPATNGMIEYFVAKLDGVTTRLTFKDRQEFAASEGMRYRAVPAGIVTGPIGSGELNLPEAARLLAELARSRTKFTLTSPYMLAKVLMDHHYANLPDLTLAIGQALAEQVRNIQADVIQVDEANLTGHPEDAGWAAEALNLVLEAIPAGREKAVHLCFGNYGGQSIQRGTYQKLVDFMNRLHLDHVVLEMARRDPLELEFLTELDPRIGVGLGVIDIKDNQVETPDEVARRIDRAARLLGAERIKYVHPDCGFWMLPRPIADAKMRSLVAGRDRYEANNF
jgi:5-methyltetrahydropteroyltriglutamate--homocysteine methyltransferase